jgi:uncharacterized protein (DUF1786 family)
MSKKIKFIIITAAVAFCIVFSGNIYSSIKSYKYRRLCDKYREQLVATENANRTLNDRLGRVTEVVGRLHETTERNVTDARGIIETVEMLRTQIQELEIICYGSDSIDSYYNYWDNIYGLE